MFAKHLALINEALLRIAWGELDRLIIQMPPRHGKSELTSHYFPTWFLGNWPEKNVILVSYESDIAAKWGRRVRDSLSEANEIGVFPGVKVRSDIAAAGRWEIEKYGGGMLTAGIGAAITGHGADCLIIDDPVKNAEEASSPTYRERNWDWWTSTARTRLEPGAAVIVIQTRWHMDDLAGRLQAEESGDWTVLSLPALAEENDPLNRPVGAALWPERYDEGAMTRTQHEVSVYDFCAMYQQRPVARSGGMFKREWFDDKVESVPTDAFRVRFWDKAATEGGGDWTVGLKMATTGNGKYFVEDVKRAQRSSGGVEQLILATAEEDGYDVVQCLEREPGSSGKDVVASYRWLLLAYSVREIVPSANKALRAEPYAARCEAGDVKLKRAHWNEEYVEELCVFPKGVNDDQVDASSGAYTGLTRFGVGKITVFSSSDGDRATPETIGQQLDRISKGAAPGRTESKDIPMPGYESEPAGIQVIGYGNPLEGHEWENLVGLTPEGESAT